MMNRFLLSLLVILTIATVPFSTAQERQGKFWIFFSSKDNISLTKSASQHDVARSIGLSERAIARRTKVSPQIISVEDLPITASYLTTMEQNGIVIRNRSRWFNAVTAELSDAQREMVQQLPFVRSVEPVVIFKRVELPAVSSPLPKNSIAAAADPDSQLYGRSLAHMKMINAVAVHKIGIKGRGVLVGMLDTGFRWKIHEAMKNMNVIAEYDFIQKDNNTANENGDALSQDTHGTGTMSLVGAYKEGQLVSPAFNASFILGKTEYVPSETNVEEANWAEAAEWMEGQGVDIISSSLGYKDFDAGQKSYVYADMNGRTTAVSQAAALAARKGVVVVNAMGNEGAGLNPPTITAPADADSILSVGALTGSGIGASFSSNGPTSDGRIKPDVSAHGVGTYWATPNGVSTYSGSSQGTSLATPLVAGAAAMILSAHPELTPIQVRDALRNTAANADKPNNAIGWGLINAYQAVLYNGMVMSTDPEVTFTKDSNYLVGMFVVSKSPVKKDSVRLFYTLNNGSTFISVPMTLGEIVDTATNSGRYFCTVPFSGVTPKFYVRAVDGTNVSRTNPHTAPTELYDANTGTTGVPKPNPIPSEFVLSQNYPNPFNPATIISFDAPKAALVSVKVYDVLGKEVAQLFNGEATLGRHSIQFSSAGLSSGVYFYRLQSGDFVQTKRMMIIK